MISKDEVGGDGADSARSHRGWKRVSGCGESASGSTYMFYPPGFSARLANIRISSSSQRQTLVRTDDGACTSARPISLSGTRQKPQFYLLLHIFDFQRLRTLGRKPSRGQSRAAFGRFHKAFQVVSGDADERRSKPPRFTVSGDGWMLTSEEALAPEKRPDSAYRETFHTSGSTIWVDPKGRRVEFPTAPAVALTTDRSRVR